jgi:eukaryotic-like serine/threonine-protein kinase
VVNVRRAEALLETLDVETRDTLAGAPRATMRPRAGHDTARRALAMLEQLSGSTSVQVRPGDEIGRGGMGVIRAAEQVALGRTVAIKTVRPDHRDPDAALDLLREAWITGSLEHPNVVPVHHLGVDDRGLPLIVLKRIEGVAWADVLGDAEAVRARFGAGDLLAWNLGILLRVLDAIRFAHSRGIIHRDLKPSNVMIGDFGEVYLLDWGIAVSLHPDPSGRLPHAGDARQIVGTPCYMAPEMVDTQMALSERTDVYLAGAVLCELLSGRPPHLAPTPIATMASIALSQPELPNDAPPELAAICRRAMHLDPAERYTSADELRRVIQGYLEHRGSELLAMGAQARLGQLRAALAAGDEDEVHRLFGALRFGFHEALSAWPDNAAARTGLTEATIAVAEFELAHDAPAAAVALLGELQPPPPLLAKARAAAERQREQRKALDLSVNANSRSLLVAAFGVVFTLVPLVMQLVPPLSLAGHAELTAGCWLAFVITMPVCCIAYRRFGTTEVDRRLLLAIPLMFFMQGVVATGGWLLGAPTVYVVISMPALWGTMCGLVAVLAEPRIAPAALGYIAAFFAGAAMPADRLYVMSAANAVLAINALAWYRLKCRLHNSSDAARS